MAAGLWKAVKEALEQRKSPTFVGRSKDVLTKSCLNRPGFTGGQNSRRIARYGTDTQQEDLEAVFT